VLRGAFGSKWSKGAKGYKCYIMGSQYYNYHVAQIKRMG
jgi:hypothetical protein